MTIKQLFSGIIVPEIPGEIVHGYIRVTSLKCATNAQVGKGNDIPENDHPFLPGSLLGFTWKC